MPAAQLRYVAAVPVALFGLILLTVSLLRRRHRLEAEIARRAEAEEQLRKANAELEIARAAAHVVPAGAGGGDWRNSTAACRTTCAGRCRAWPSLARMAYEKLQQGDADLAKRALPAIAEQANASTKLVSTLLELARLDDAALQQERVNLEELVRSAYAEVTLGLGGAAPPVLRCGALPEVTADAALLRPALVNLLANAAKFSREASAPAIDVDVGIAGRAVTVSVRDNGVGFEPAVADKLFDPFYRAHPARFEGHGLGPAHRAPRDRAPRRPRVGAKRRQRSRRSLLHAARGRAVGRGAAVQRQSGSAGRVQPDQSGPNSSASAVARLWRNGSSSAR